MDLLDYLGQPWSALAFNCWGLVRQVYARERGVELPPVAVDPHDYRALCGAFAGHDARSLFQRIEAPAPLCVVALGRRGEILDHVGVWVDVDGGRVLHNDHPTGVVCQRLIDMRRAGWRVLGYYDLRNPIPDEHRLPAQPPGCLHR